MRIRRVLIYTAGLFLSLPSDVLAHCPLCTVGAGFLAAAAASIGVSAAVLGVLIGAFALALGLWAAKGIKSKRIRHQDTAVSLGVFLATILPIMPLIRDYRGVYIPFLGEYGITYAVNLYLLGVLIGAVLLFSAPHMSRLLTRIRKGQTWPFQGVSVTLLLLIIGAVAVQVVL